MISQCIQTTTEPRPPVTIAKAVKYHSLPSTPMGGPRLTQPVFFSRHKLIWSHVLDVLDTSYVVYLTTSPLPPLASSQPIWHRKQPRFNPPHSAYRVLPASTREPIARSISPTSPLSLYSLHLYYNFLTYNGTHLSTLSSTTTTVQLLSNYSRITLRSHSQCSHHADLPPSISPLRLSPPLPPLMLACLLSLFPYYSPSSAHNRFRRSASHVQELGKGMRAEMVASA